MLINMKIKLFIINPCGLTGYKRINLDTLRIFPPQDLAEAHPVA
jgi:hypothetical protein